MGQGKALKKVTLELSEELIRTAQLETGEGLTETVRQGLQLLAARRASRNLSELRGKIDLKLDLEELRKDRRS